MLELKERIEKWFSDRKLDVRPYQVNNILQMLKIMLQPGNHKIIFHDPGGGGKSIQVICTLNIYKELVSEKVNICILPHGTEVLRNNFAGNIKKVTPDFITHLVNGNDNLDYGPTVIKWDGKLPTDSEGLTAIALPQNEKYITTIKYDTIVIDEAHQFYGAKNGMMDSIINSSQPKNIILMTATPCCFLKEKDKYEWVGIDLYELLRLGHANHILVELALTSNIDFNPDEDMTDKGNLKDEVLITSKATTDGLSAMVHKIITHLEWKNPGAGKIFSPSEWSNMEWGSIFVKLKKTIIYCRNIKDANSVLKILEAKKVKACIAHSELTDAEGAASDEVLEEFKKDDNNVLVAVYMARLGFDMPDLFNVVDFTMTINTDIIAQMLLRLSRIPSDKQTARKIFLKIVPSIHHPYYERVMKKTLYLLDIECLKGSADGKEFIDTTSEEYDEIKRARKEERGRSKDTMDTIRLLIKETPGGLLDEVLDELMDNPENGTLFAYHKRLLVEENSKRQGKPMAEKNRKKYFPSIGDISNFHIMDYKKHKDDDPLKVYVTTTTEKVASIINSNAAEFKDILDKEIDDEFFNKPLKDVIKGVKKDIEDFEKDTE